MYYTPTPDRPIGGFCRHKTDVMGPIKTTSYSYDSDSDDYISYSTPTYTYGCNTSYSTVYSGVNQYSVPTVHHSSNVSWSTQKVSSGIPTCNSTSSTSWGVIRQDDCSCVQCECSYCTSEQGIKDSWDAYNRRMKKESEERQKRQEEEYRQRKLEQERIRKVEAEKRAWRNADFTERRKMRGTFRAILRLLRETFLCSVKQ